MAKPWVVTEFYNHCGQKVKIEPTPEFDGIKLSIGEADDSKRYDEFFIIPDELPVLIEKLQEMMNYVTKTK